MLQKLHNTALLFKHRPFWVFFIPAGGRAFYTLPSITGSTIISSGFDSMSVNVWIIARLQVFSPAFRPTKRDLISVRNNISDDNLF